MRSIDAMSSAVIEAAIGGHRDLGPSLFETVYETVLAGRLDRAGWLVERQVAVPLTLDDHHFDGAFRVDILVERRLVGEITAVERLTGVHARQVLTYLRLLKQPVGLLMNFSGGTMKEAIRRLVNDYRPD
ncbi:GxxExxY protein [Novosphingobium sp.]|uniref:GxxExxY protein n=1 Tax=Novosphingobium sp. TaxID=1874826 RepID=UPI00261860E3|nr:GxxExxY protein [Novosphingobium sp.]